MSCSHLSTAWSSSSLASNASTTQRRGSSAPRSGLVVRCSLRELRTRIDSVKNTQKITEAMKLVAAAKVRRAQEAVVSSRPFSEALPPNQEIQTEDIDLPPNASDLTPPPPPLPQQQQAAPALAPRPPQRAGPTRGASPWTPLPPWRAPAQPATGASSVACSSSTGDGSWRMGEEKRSRGDEQRRGVERVTGSTRELVQAWLQKNGPPIRFLGA
ncbi:hypothetical protein BDA96_04G182300 [Sorghum bicolor]|uniref:F-ATPase gamma subunit n=2 Tax=Sorghum bicolor TaxID=4558 RepID=C5XU28_SORBI|nr:hypothetical protein SORBI_3004G169800 [Sorghum bicolor]KAG0533309.1 hypothetical protein BDA96_04G182300 [Sorghum bicolor]